MAIATTNPATGQLIKTFEPLTDAQIERSSSARRRPSRGSARRRSPSARKPMTKAAEFSRPRRKLRQDDDPGDGQDVTLRRRGSGQMRLGLPLLRGQRGEIPGRRDRRDRREEKLCALPAARPGARGDALELPLLAGDPRGGARADGGQRDAAEARFERAAMRAADRGSSTAGPASLRRFSDAADRRGQVDSILNDPRVVGDADRQRRCRRPGGHGGGEARKKVGARTGRQRSFHRDAEREPR